MLIIFILRGPPFLSVTQATMYLPVPGMKSVGGRGGGSVFVDECYSSMATVTAKNHGGVTGVSFQLQMGLIT